MKVRHAQDPDQQWHMLAANNLLINGREDQIGWTLEAVWKDNQYVAIRYLSTVLENRP